jgi:hypothetical protein
VDKTFGFGSLGTSYSEYFTPKKLESALGTEAVRNAFTINEKLNTAVFSADGGLSSASPNIEQNTKMAVPPTPSTRPYFWKYQ